MPAIMIGLLWLAVGTLAAADFETKSLAVAVTADTQPISSSMFLKCPVKEYNGIKPGAFRSLRHDLPEDAFVKYITAVQNRDYSQFNALSTLPTNAEPEPSMTPQQIAKTQLDGLRAGCGSCQEINLIRQVKVGPRFLFVFETTLGGQWGRAGLEFYRTAWLAVRRQQWDQFIGYHTAVSRGFLEEERLKNKAVFASNLANQATMRYIKFVVNADPIYLIYYSSQASNDWRPGTLRYEYVIRDTGSQRYQLASTLSWGNLENFLKDGRLFDQTIFKSTFR